MKRPKMRKGASNFFYAAAGYSSPIGADAATQRQYRRDDARNLAVAEYWAWDNSYTFEWAMDDNTSEDFSDEKPFYTLWCCIMRDESSASVQSLGGIDFGRDVSPWGQSYKRVVEAELALEQMPVDART